MSEETARRVETVTVDAADGELRLDRWFKRHYPLLTHTHLQKLLRTGQIRVDGKRAEAGTRLGPGQIVRVPPLPDQGPMIPEDRLAPGLRAKPAYTEAEGEELRRRVLYRDPDVIVLDKPAGLATQGGTNQPKHLDAMLDALAFDAPTKPKLVHRLDKDTSGCLVLARSAAAASRLTAAFRSRDARKIYWALTVGVPEPRRGRIDLALAKEAGAKGERMAVDPENGQHAITYYTVLEEAHRRAAFVALWPRTGRTHQLRVHLQALGQPILGDGKYAGQGAFIDGADLPKALHLHARRIVLPHPSGQGTIDVTAPLPKHLRSAWDYFGFSTNLKDDPFAELDFG